MRQIVRRHWLARKGPRPALRTLSIPCGFLHSWCIQASRCASNMLWQARCCCTGAAAYQLCACTGCSRGSFGSTRCFCLCAAHIHHTGIQVLVLAKASPNRRFICVVLVARMWVRLGHRRLVVVFFAAREVVMVCAGCCCRRCCSDTSRACTICSDGGCAILRRPWCALCAFALVGVWGFVGQVVMLGCVVWELNAVVAGVWFGRCCPDHFVGKPTTGCHIRCVR
jgi:hypothetical protein